MNASVVVINNSFTRRQSKAHAQLCTQQYRRSSRAKEDLISPTARHRVIILLQTTKRNAKSYSTLLANCLKLRILESWSKVGILSCQTINLVCSRKQFCTRNKSKRKSYFSKYKTFNCFFRVCWVNYALLVT